jgi:hypothetical protein
MLAVVFRAPSFVAALALLASSSCARISDSRQPFVMYADPRIEPDPGPHEAGPCDPLRETERPIHLDAPIAVGRARDGTMYLFERAGTVPAWTYRSGDGRFERQRDAEPRPTRGRGVFVQAFSGPHIVVLGIDESANERGWIARRHVRMWRVEVSATTERARRGERLRVLDPAAVRSWPAFDRPREISIEYLAHTPDGRWLMVTMPEMDFEHVRVFFGTAQNVRERPFVRMARQRDGGTTNVTFEVEGEVLVAHFPVRCGVASPPNVLGTRADCPAELRRGPSSIELVRAPADRIGGLAFVCSAAERSVGARVFARARVASFHGAATDQSAAAERP